MEALELDVVLAGSVYKGAGPLLVDTVTQAVHVLAPRARVVRLRAEPVVGGLLLAYDAVGRAAGHDVHDNVMATLPGSDFFDTQSATG